MEKIAVWVAPLFLLPGVATLVLSTAQRYSRVHEEFHRLLDHSHGSPDRIANNLLRRATLFRNALISFYVSIGLLTLASMVGAFCSYWLEEGFWVAHLLTGIGVLALLYGAMQLVRESFRSMTMIQIHYDQVMQEENVHE